MQGLLSFCCCPVMLLLPCQEAGYLNPLSPLRSQAGFSCPWTVRSLKPFQSLHEPAFLGLWRACAVFAGEKGKPSLCLREKRPFRPDPSEGSVQVSAFVLVFGTITGKSLCRAHGRKFPPGTRVREPVGEAQFHPRTWLGGGQARLDPVCLPLHRPRAHQSSPCWGQHVYVAGQI